MREAARGTPPQDLGSRLPGALLLALLAAHAVLGAVTWFSTVSARPPAALEPLRELQYPAFTLLMLAWGLWLLFHRERLLRLGPAGPDRWDAERELLLDPPGLRWGQIWVLANGLGLMLLEAALGAVHEVVPRVLTEETAALVLDRVQPWLLLVGAVASLGMAGGIARADRRARERLREATPESMSWAARRGVEQLSLFVRWLLPCAGGAAFAGALWLTSVELGTEHAPLVLSLLIGLAPPATVVLGAAAAFLLLAAVVQGVLDLALLPPEAPRPLRHAAWAAVPGVQLVALPRLLAALPRRSRAAAGGPASPPAAAGAPADRRGGAAADLAGGVAGLLLAAAVSAVLVERLLAWGLLPGLLAVEDPTLGAAALLPAAAGLAAAGVLLASWVLHETCRFQRRAAGLAAPPAATAPAAAQGQPAPLS